MTFGAGTELRGRNARRLISLAFLSSCGRPQSPHTEHAGHALASSILALTSKSSVFTPATLLSLRISGHTQKIPRSEPATTHEPNQVVCACNLWQMASSKSTKRSTDAAPDPSKMSNLERLILVQAVYEFGNNAWPEVSKLLSSHPMLVQSKQRFSPQVSASAPHPGSLLPTKPVTRPQFCNIVYLKLMQDAGLEW